MSNENIKYFLGVHPTKRVAPTTPAPLVLELPLNSGRMHDDEVLNLFVMMSDQYNNGETKKALCWCRATRPQSSFFPLWHIISTLPLKGNFDFMTNLTQINHNLTWSQALTITIITIHHFAYVAHTEASVLNWDRLHNLFKVHCSLFQ